MTIDREKIKELMNRLNFPAFNDWGYELMELFHNAVRDEALEEAAKECDALANCEENTVGYRHGASWCAERIRAMKENK